MKRDGLYWFAIGALVAAIAVMDSRQRRLLREYAYDRRKLREVVLELESIREENRRRAEADWERQVERAVDFRQMPLMQDDPDSLPANVTTLSRSAS